MDTIGSKTFKIKIWDFSSGRKKKKERGAFYL